MPRDEIKELEKKERERELQEEKRARGEEDDKGKEKYAVPKWDPADAKCGEFTEESSFAVLFPVYREMYLKTHWPRIQEALKPFGIAAELDLVQGTMNVKTTRSTRDPFMIIKSRDLMRLLARSVPVDAALTVLDDDVTSDIVKLKGFVRNKGRFIKRRGRLLGKDGATLRALELLTDTRLFVQGGTVAVIGPYKSMGIIRDIIEDCMMNIHPVYHIKELMVKRELMKMPEMKGKDWSKFLPRFKTKSQKHKPLKSRKIRKHDTFPAPPQPSKEDLAMASGEYFMRRKLAEHNAAADGADD